MVDKSGPVVPKRAAPTELEFHAALVSGLARVANTIGRGNLADKSQRTPRALNKLFAGDNLDTSGKGLLDFLLADLTALDEVLARYGVGVHRITTADADDFATIADTAALSAAHTEAMRDGSRDHRDTLKIADKARPVVAEYSGIIAEADRIRGVA